MTSTRPYLLRAIYDWIVDNNMTPHLLVVADHPQAEVPQQFVEDGRIVLNVSPQAVRDLDLGNEFISFNARFAGTPQDVFVPVEGVEAIYSRENGQGIFLGEAGGGDGEIETVEEADPGPENTHKKKDGGAPGGKPPYLTIVK